MVPAECSCGFECLRQGSSGADAGDQECAVDGERAALRLHPSDRPAEGLRSRQARREEHAFRLLCDLTASSVSGSAGRWFLPAPVLLGPIRPESRRNLWAWACELCLAGSQNTERPEGYLPEAGPPGG